MCLFSESGGSRGAWKGFMPFAQSVRQGTRPVGVPSGMGFGWERTLLLRLWQLGRALVLARHSTLVDEQTADP